LLSNEYQFIVERINGKSWTDVTTEFNKEFQLALSPGALKKRYDREISKLEVLGSDTVEKAFKLIKTNPVKPTELAKRFNLDMDGLEDLMDDLLQSRAAIKFHQGYLIFDKTAPTPDFMTHNISLFKDDGWYKFGIISDTHNCSAHEMIDFLHGFYQICEEEKVKAVIHGGDFTSGNGTVCRGQYQDLKIVGEDEQINYVCNTYPEPSTFKTYAISGNHDLDLYKQCGSDIMQKIADKREDIVYLGKMVSTIDIDGITFLVQHGEGGLGLIRSYKPQRIIDAQRAEDICDFAVIGHWHINLYMPSYRGCNVILPGCFEAQSDYLTKKSLVPDINGCILNVKVEDVGGVKTVVRHHTDFLDFGSIM
jgi:predicted phosphodiesterase